MADVIRLPSSELFATGRVAPSPLASIRSSCCALDQNGLGHHRTCPARTGEPGDGRQEVKNQDGQVAHGTIVTSERNPRNTKELRIHARVARGRRSQGLIK